MSRRNRRVEALEGPKSKKHAPCVIFVRPGETGTETLDRIEREAGVRPVRPIGVPEPVTDEAEFLGRFKAQQLRSIARAKSLRLRTHCDSQKMTVPAMNMADMNEWAHRS